MIAQECHLQQLQRQGVWELHGVDKVRRVGCDSIRCMPELFYLLFNINLPIILILATHMILHIYIT